MAVASRLISPTNSRVTHCATRAWWIFSPSPISTNSAQAREKVDSEGTSARFTKPQIRRKTGTARKASIVARMLGWLYTALATMARARAWRPRRFRPNLWEGRPANFSVWASSKMLTNCWSFPVNGRSQHSSRPGIKLRCKVPTNHYTASLSFIGASLCFRFFSQNHLSTGALMRLIFSINQP
jgi:hypothetical protein